jgi:putative nucleotidyltransferase with HDIG domain
MTQLQKPAILPESRARLVAAIDGPQGSSGEVISIAETDIGLALAVLSRANRLPHRPRGGIVSVIEAVTALGTGAIGRLADELPDATTASDDAIGAALIRLAPHAVATRAAAEAVAVHTGATHRDTLRLAALVHDVGKVALAAASGTYIDRALDPRVRPEDRVAGERRRMGIDHAGLGGIALGRLGLPRSVAMIVERHHAEDADGGAAIVRLADLLAHEARGDAVDPVALAAAGAAVGMDELELRELAYELTRAGGPRSANLEPSPLTPMQHKVLLGLRRGLTYKQIAAELQVSESTVRSHLHKAYERMGVVDRAQAVLLAQDRGWI